MDGSQCIFHWEMGILTLLREHNSWAQLYDFLAPIVRTAIIYIGGMLHAESSHCYADHLVQEHPHDSALQCLKHLHPAQVAGKGVLWTFREASLHDSICFPFGLALVGSCHNCTRVEFRLFLLVEHHHRVVEHHHRVVEHHHRVVEHLYHVVVVLG